MQLAEERGSNNFSPNLAEVIGGAFLTDLDSPYDDHSERPQSAGARENAANVRVFLPLTRTVVTLVCAGGGAVW